MLNIYKLIGDIKCTEIVVSLTFTHKIVGLEGWIGAHIRNMLLAACSEVECPEYGSLMDRINLFTLEDVNHPWHKELKGGFPKAYTIKVLSNTKRGYEQTIERGEQVQFSVTLIGSLSSYTQEMISAIDIFAKRGIHGSMDYDINSVKQHSMLELLYDKCDDDRLKIDFITPISLLSNNNSPNSLHSKMNGFISIYQMVLSAVNRVVKMAVLYSGCKATTSELSEAIQEVSIIASNMVLDRCNLSHTVLTTAKRRATKDKMVFDGLIGETQWRGDHSQLYPLLKFCSYISLGDNVVYGMGHFVVSTNMR